MSAEAPNPVVLSSLRLTRFCLVPLAQIAFVQMLTNALPPQYIQGQARASQHYWSEVLNYAAQGTSSPYYMSGSSSRLGFSWLSNAGSVSYWTGALQGLVGVSAGMRPPNDFQTGGTADVYSANALEINTADPTGGSNPAFLFHLPSAYSFEPELPGLRANLISMWNAGMGMWRVPVNKVINNAWQVGSDGGTCTCPNGDVYQVGGVNNGCSSLACVHGISGTCSTNNPGGAGVMVICDPTPIVSGELRVPWQGSLRYPGWWAPAQMNMVDYSLIAFGLPRAFPDVFGNGSFVLPVHGSQQGPTCDAALYKPIASSSTVTFASSGTYNANDGDDATSWFSVGNSSEWWLALDLEEATTMVSVTVQWGVNHPTQYTIEGGWDGQSWTLAHTESGGASFAVGQQPNITSTLTTPQGLRWLRIRSSGQASGVNVRETGVVGVGGWGGTCTCPNGAVYQVGDNGDSCATIACIGGISGTCSGNNPGGGGVRVTCGLPAASVREISVCDAPLPPPSSQVTPPPPTLSPPPLLPATSSSPPSPSPTPPPGTTGVTFSLAAAGSVTDYTTTVIDGIKAAVATTAGNGATAADVAVTVTAGSVVIDVTISTPAASASSVQSSISAATTDASAATTMLSSVSVAGGALTVSAITQAPFTGTYPPPPPPSPPPQTSSSSSGMSTGALVGIIIGCIVAVAALVAAGFVLMRRRGNNKVQVVSDGVAPGQTDGAAPGETASY